MQTFLFAAVFAILFSGLATLVPAIDSIDGTCGPARNYTCYGEIGNCCSSSGWCGNTTAHCGGGCQTLFGKCGGGKATPDGTCGGVNGYICGGAYGKCCSMHGYCGNDSNFCGVGCQSPFSVNGSCSALPPSIDGTCGAKAGVTCTGGEFDGQCCSGHGFCGKTSAHCAVSAGCQPGFGKGCI